MKYALEFLRYAIDGRKVKALVISCLVFTLSLLVGCRTQQATDMERWEAEKAQLIAQQEQLKAEHAAELEALVKQTEAGIYATQYLPQEYMGDAYKIGRWLTILQEIYPGISAEARGLACWGLFCREESDLYPDDIESILLQPGQFNEYDPDAKPTEENVIIAQNQLSRWINGDIRPCGEGAVYISISSQGVVLRDTFEEGRQTNYWRA